MFTFLYEKTAIDYTCATELYSALYFKMGQHVPKKRCNQTLFSMFSIPCFHPLFLGFTLNAQILIYDL